jgi:probable HAF family extracellular repeat protein
MSLEKIIKGIKKAKQSLKTLAYSAVIGAASLGVLAGNAEAGNPRYKIEKLSTSDSKGSVVNRNSLNEYGEIVGFVDVNDIKKPFLYKNGTIRKLEELDVDLPTPYYNSGPYVGPYYTDILTNDLGYIFLFYYYPHYSIFISIYKLGEKIDLDFQAEDTNNKGEVVGEHYLWKDGEKIDLNFINGQQIYFVASSINDKGQIAGRYYNYDHNIVPAIWENGVITELECPSYEDRGELFYYKCFPIDINNKKQVVGLGGGACMWDENGKFRSLGGGIAFAINDNGQIVGNSMDDPPRTPDYAFLYQNGKEFNLNDLLTENSEFTYLYSALDINNKGQIVGNGIIRGSSNTYAFIMTPIPLEGDLNEDGIVNLRDLSELANHWLEERKK